MKIVTNIFFLILLSVSAATPASAQGGMATLEPELSGFDRVETGHGCKLSISRSDSFSVVVRINENLADHLRVEVKGSRLVIRLDSGHWHGRVKLEADVQMPDIRALSLSGGSDATLDRFDLQHEFEADLSGGSRLRGSLGASRLALSFSGGSEAELEGNSSEAEVEGSGGSKFRLNNWETDDLQVHLSGGSSAAMSVRNSISGSLSGGSEVRYKGDPPSIDVSRSGGSRVKQM